MSRSRPAAAGGRWAAGSSAEEEGAADGAFVESGGLDAVWLGGESDAACSAAAHPTTATQQRGTRIGFRERSSIDMAYHSFLVTMWDLPGALRRSRAMGFGPARSCTTAGLLLLLSACGEPARQPVKLAPQPEASTPVETAVPAPASAAASSAPPSPPSQAAALPIDPKSPSAVAIGLGANWCGSGTENAPACPSIKVEVTEKRDAGSMQTAVLRLVAEETPIEERHYLYMRRGDHVAVAPLAVGISSGVGGFSHEITLSKIAIADRTGDAEPEWSAEVEVDVHDSDMGLCRLKGTLERDLVVCGPKSDVFQCSKTPLVRSAYEEQATVTDGGCGKNRVTNRGFSLVAELDDKNVILKVAPKNSDQPFTRAVRPPFSGTVSVSKLMASSPLKVQPFAD